MISRKLKQRGCVSVRDRLANHIKSVYSRFSKVSFVTCGAVLLAAANLSSCSGTDLGKDLSIDAEPSTAYIVASDAPSCSDYYNQYLSTQSSASTTTTLSTSVTGPRLYFPNFKLQWRGTDPLTVAVMRVTVVANGTTALSPFQVDLDIDEISALLGNLNGLIPAGVTINSNNAKNRGIYPACGLNVGGISVTDVSTPTIPASGISDFTARVMIEVIGTYQSASDGTYHPVKQTWYGSATYLN